VARNDFSYFFVVKILNSTKIEILAENRNYNEILVKNIKFWLKIEILFQNQNIGQKSEMFVKNRNFCQNRIFCQNWSFCQNRIFLSELKFLSIEKLFFSKIKILPKNINCKNFVWIEIFFVNKTFRITKFWSKLEMKLSMKFKNKIFQKTVISCNCVSPSTIIFGTCTFLYFYNWYKILCLCNYNIMHKLIFFWEKKIKKSKLYL